MRAALPTHIALTREEAGCLSFEVTQTDDSLVWAVAERFVDAAAFEAHQTRAVSIGLGQANQRHCTRLHHRRP